MFELALLLRNFVSFVRCLKQSYRYFCLNIQWKNGRIVETKAMADLENQPGDGGLSEGTAVMVETRFLRPIRGSTTLFFVFAEEK